MGFLCCFGSPADNAGAQAQTAHKDQSSATVPQKHDNQPATSSLVPEPATEQQVSNPAAAAAAAAPPQTSNQPPSSTEPAQTTNTLYTGPENGNSLSTQPITNAPATVAASIQSTQQMNTDFLGTGTSMLSTQVPGSGPASTTGYQRDAMTPFHQRTQGKYDAACQSESSFTLERAEMPLAAVAALGNAVDSPSGRRFDERIMSMTAGSMDSLGGALSPQLSLAVDAPSFDPGQATIKNLTVRELNDEIQDLTWIGQGASGDVYRGEPL